MAAADTREKMRAPDPLPGPTLFDLAPAAWPKAAAKAAAIVGAELTSLSRMTPESATDNAVESYYPPNDDAIRLWQVDMALLHISRNQGVLGLGANATQQSLRVEREEIITRLQALGAALVGP